jgi:hypothetical protein
VDQVAAALTDFQVEQELPVKAMPVEQATQTLHFMEEAVVEPVLLELVVEVPAAALVE